MSGKTRWWWRRLKIWIFIFKEILLPLTPCVTLPEFHALLGPQFLFPKSNQLICLLFALIISDFIFLCIFLFFIKQEYVALKKPHLWAAPQPSLVLRGHWLTYCLGQRQLVCHHGAEPSCLPIMSCDFTGHVIAAFCLPPVWALEPESPTPFHSK